MEYGPNRDAVVVARRMVALGAAALMALAGSAHAQDKEKEKKAAPPPATAPGASKPAGKPVTTPPVQPTKTATPMPVNAPTASPASAGATERAPLPDIVTDDPNMITLAAFSGPVDLTALIELLARTLDINVTMIGDVTGQVVFNAPKAIPKDRFLPFVDALLNQQNYTITYDPVAQFYVVQQIAAVASELDGERATTRVISTPNVRPSSLQTALSAQLAAVAGQAGGRQLSFVDELGIIIATDSVRKLDQLEALVKRILEEYSKTSWIRIELDHVAAPVARERALQLVGQSSGVSRGFGDPNQPQQPQVVAGGRGQSLDNLGDRLTVDAQGNAVIFRGFPEEIQQVQTVLAIIDKPSQLQPKRYNVGGAARQVADIAKQRGLGEVTTIQSDTQDGQFNQQPQFQNQQFQNQFNRQGLGQVLSGGSVMVVDESRGSILYYGTEDQQRQMERLVEELDIQSESLVIRAYKLVNSDAEKMADLINGLIRNETPAASNPLLGEGGTSTFGGANPFGPRVQRQPQTRQQNAQEANPNDLSITGNAFVIANKALNQVLIKSAAKQQPEFAKLIEKLDLRRPQVYVEAKIVVVNWTDDLRLAFETQLINAGGKGGLINTNFGLGAFGTTAVPTAITGPKTVSSALGGFTGALINSNYVPIIMTALQKEVDGRILATPQLLMDDNEESKLVSVDQQPTTVTTIGTGTGTSSPNTTSFGNYVDAGTELTITPHISDGGYLRMKYHVKLSSFTSPSGSPGIPPPRQENTLDSDSVTVPSDMTIILGGLTLDQKGRTQVKIPLIGDIPILGQLFKDDNKNDRKTTLYVFLTPRIMRDPNFLDLRLKTRGPRNTSLIADDFPALVPTMIDGADLRPIVPATPANKTEPAPNPPAPSEPAPSPSAPVVPMLEKPAAEQPKPATPPTPELDSPERKDR